MPLGSEDVYTRLTGNGQSGTRDEKSIAARASLVGGVEGDGGVERGDDLGNDAGLHETGLEVGGRHTVGVDGVLAADDDVVVRGGGADEGAGG